MRYDFYDEFLDDHDQLEVFERDLAHFGDDEDLDVYLFGEIRFMLGGEKYRLRVKEKENMVEDLTDYEVSIAKSQKREIDDSWTNYRRLDEGQYSKLNDSGFETILRDKLDEELPTEIPQDQETLI